MEFMTITCKICARLLDETVLKKFTDRHLLTILKNKNTHILPVYVRWLHISLRIPLR
jgi:hypothetical protein